MANQIMFTETLEESNGRLQEIISVTGTGDVRYNSFFAGSNNGKLFHFDEPHSKGSKSWRFRKHLFYLRPEKGAYILVECKITNNGNIHVYGDFRGMAAQKERSSRIDKVMHNGILQKLDKSKKGRCEACGTKSNRTHWAHLVNGKDLPVAELCICCHKIYDLQNGCGQHDN